MLSKEFILVSLTTAFTSIIYLIISGYLDNYISKIVSNGIGLAVDITLDFIFQSYIFLNKFKITDFKNIYKFLISKIISTLSSQLLFILYINNYYNKEINITFVRMIISSIVFIFVVFPMSKFYVFTK